mmetsp:Transcript_84970/g.168665  ORF Transcript_84970/g.168665 Transcript_84970/m.168665 type:complete len:122 (-) Transcript_84970:90-455(-)
MARCSMVAALGVAFAAVVTALEATPRAPMCFDVQCAEITCKAPFKLRRKEGQCCDICWASDEDIALDRHTALGKPSPYRTETHPAAPTTCAGAFCFKPACGHGFKPGHVSGRCCAGCVPGF